MTATIVGYILLVYVSVLAWFTLGCLVLSSIDDEEQSLFKWASAAPLGLYVPTVLFWPVVLIIYKWKNK
jgi:NADH:ubiquinone oxidoreductase subunit 6 (subunit J)